jgi:hypothetical protein
MNQTTIAYVVTAPGQEAGQSVDMGIISVMMAYEDVLPVALRIHVGTLR